MPRIESNRIKTQDNKMHSLQLLRCFPKRIPFNFHYLMSSVCHGTAQHKTHTHTPWDRDRGTRRHTQTHALQSIMVNERHSGSILFSFVRLWKFVCLFVWALQFIALKINSNCNIVYFNCSYTTICYLIYLFIYFDNHVFSCWFLFFCHSCTLFMC